MAEAQIIQVSRPRTVEVVVEPREGVVIDQVEMIKTLISIGIPPTDVQSVQRMDWTFFITVKSPETDTINQIVTRLQKDTATRIKGCTMQARRAPDIRRQVEEAYTTLHIFNAPYELPDQDIEDKLLRDYGFQTVRSKRGTLRLFPTIESGVRHFTGKVVKDVKRYFFVKSCKIHCKYEGQPDTRVCYKCQERGHLAMNCNNTEAPPRGPAWGGAGIVQIGPKTQDQVLKIPCKECGKDDHTTDECPDMNYDNPDDDIRFKRIPTPPPVPPTPYMMGPPPGLGKPDTVQVPPVTQITVEAVIESGTRKEVSGVPRHTGDTRPKSHPKTSVKQKETEKQVVTDTAQGGDTLKPPDPALHISRTKERSSSKVSRTARTKESRSVSSSRPREPTPKRSAHVLSPCDPDAKKSQVFDLEV